MKTILLTDGEFTGMIRTLKDLSEPVRIAGFVSSENAAHTAFLDGYAVAPSWRDEAYLPFLIDYAKKEHVYYIFPIVTTSLEFMAQNAEKIFQETGAVVITSPAESIRIANNKALLFDALSGDGAPVTPEGRALSEFITPFFTARTVGELRGAVNHFTSQGIPCISKPCCGENAEGFMRFVSEKEFAEKRLLGEASSLAALSVFDCYGDGELLPEERLVMPYLPGEEWDVDVLVKDGEVAAATVRKNLSMFGGLSACTVTVDRPDILDCCRGIVKHLGLRYLSCISFRADETGAPKLLEINPRAMGSIHLSAMAGNNLIEKLFSFPEFAENKDGVTDETKAPSGTIVTRPGFMASLYNDLAVVKDGADVTDTPVISAHGSETAGIAVGTGTCKSENGGISWNEISPPVRETYEQYYNKVQSRITDIVFNCRFAWDSLYHFRWTILEDCFVQASYGSAHSDPFLLMPLGDLTTEKLEKIVTAVREDFARHGLPLTIYGIGEKYLPLFEAMRIPHEAATYNDDFSDYLYDAESLRTLSGRKYAKKRNHLTHFTKAYPDFVYESINSTHFGECLELIRSWACEKGVDVNDEENSDYPVIENMLRHWDKLNTRGGVIKLSGKVAAFALGSFERDTAFIHFEKADASVDGLYAAINREVLLHEFPEAVYVNREEDLGIEGLRHAKQSYYPVEMVRKYKMRIL